MVVLGEVVTVATGREADGVVAAVQPVDVVLTVLVGLGEPEEVAIGREDAEAFRGVPPLASVTVPVMWPPRPRAR